MYKSHLNAFKPSRFIAFLLPICIAAGILSGCSAEEKNTAPILPTTTSEPIRLGPTSIAMATRTPGAQEFPTATLLPIPALDPRDHSLGNPEAPVTLLVYSDFQCPYCANFYHAWKQIQVLHPENVRLVFRHFPLLPIHDKADMAGAAAEIAGREQHFWEMHDLFFERQAEWVWLSRDEFLDWIVDAAGELGIEPERFREQLSGEDDLAAMRTAYQAGVDAGIPGTPFIFLNEDWYRINPTAINLESSIRLELLKARQVVEPPEYEFASGSIYFAHLRINQGEILIQLFPEQAPATVASFISLAEKGWYDGVGFHKVEPNSFVESGDPTGTSLGGPGYLLLDELSDTLNFDEIGLVAMSSSGPNTNGSRFFINLIPLPDLNGSRTIFGRVISGMEFLSGLHARDPYLDLFEPYELVIESIGIEQR